MRKIAKVEVDADALYFRGAVYLSQRSVVEALRGVASQLEAAHSVGLAPEQFRAVARAFAGLEAPPPPPPRGRRRLFGRRA